MTDIASPDDLTPTLSPGFEALRVFFSGPYGPLSIVLSMLPFQEIVRCRQVCRLFESATVVAFSIRHFSFDELLSINFRLYTSFQDCRTVKSTFPNFDQVKCEEEMCKSMTSMLVNDLGVLIPLRIDVPSLKITRKFQEDAVLDLLFPTMTPLVEVLPVIWQIINLHSKEYFHLYWWGLHHPSNRPCYVNYVVEKHQPTSEKKTISNDDSSADVEALPCSIVDEVVAPYSMKFRVSVSPHELPNSFGDGEFVEVLGLNRFSGSTFCGVRGSQFYKWIENVPSVSSSEKLALFLSSTGIVSAMPRSKSGISAADLLTHSVIYEANLSIASVVLRSASIARLVEGVSRRHYWRHHIIERLVELYSEIGLKEKFLYSSWFAMAIFERTSVMKLLVGSFGVDVTCVNEDGKNALHLACEKGFVSVCRFLLEESKSLLAVVDSNGKTPDRYCFKEGQLSHPVVLACLVNAGLPLESLPNLPRLLGDSIHSVNFELVEAFLSKRLVPLDEILPAYRERRALFPFVYASCTSCVSMVNLFVRCGDPEIIRAQAGAALRVAKDFPIRRRIQAIMGVKFWASMQTGNRKYDILVDLLLNYRYDEAEALIREANYDPEVFVYQSDPVEDFRTGEYRYPGQYSLLHVACATGAERIVEFLLAAGANVNLKAPNGLKPVYLAAFAGYSRLAIRLIKKFGATKGRGVFRARFPEIHEATYGGQDG